MALVLLVQLLVAPLDGGQVLILAKVVFPQSCWCIYLNTACPAGSPPHSGPGHLLEDPTVAGGLDITPQHGFYHLDTLDNSPECW